MNLTRVLSVVVVAVGIGVAGVGASGAPADEGTRAAVAQTPGAAAGEIVYLVTRKDAKGLASEVWAMDQSGQHKHRIKTYLGWGSAPGPWLPGQQWLLCNSSSLLWTTPDFKARRANASAGHPIVDNQMWLLNAATGQDKPFGLPPGYNPLYTALSPDGSSLAFSGRYQPDPKSQEGMEGGVWVYDLTAGSIKKVLDGWIKTPVAWAPDSRRLVASTGQGYGNVYPLVTVNTTTGEVTDLGLQGAGGDFSPDGTKVAYCGEFQGAGSWYRGVLTSGRIMVVDLKSGKASGISPTGEGAVEPRWSPDGARVAYWVSYHQAAKSRDKGQVLPAFAIFVAAADGSGSRKLYEDKARLQAFSWMPDGKNLILFTETGVRIVAADGAGAVSQLGGTADDSILTEKDAAQTKAAFDRVREAVFQYAVGNVRRFEGKPADARTAFQQSSDIFGGLARDYPLAAFSPDQTKLYADKAAQMAAVPDSEMLSKSCEERLGALGVLLGQYAGEADAFPADLADLEKHSLATSWGINWFSNKDTAWVRMIFRCPADGSYRYIPPAAGKDPEVGDVLVTCPVHAANRLIWTEQMAQDLAWRRVSAAQQAVEQDPKLKALVDEAEQARRRASHAGAPWEQAEQAYLRVLAAVPYEPTAREYLGRIYTRWGQFEKALQYLSPSSGWSSLYYAFCMDALGRRDKALAIYSQFAKGDPGWVGTQWAKLGMEKPTWPRDLDIPAEAGEVRIRPDSHWHASATATVLSDPVLTGKPELAIDGNRETSWQTSGGEAGQTPGEWFKLEFDTPLAVRRIVLDHYGEKSIYTNNWARGISAEVSEDGTTWRRTDVSQAAIFEPSTVKLSPDQPVKAIRFTTTATHDPEWWGIYEVFVFAPKG